MTLPLHSLTWDGLVAGEEDGSLQVDGSDSGGIRGLDSAQVDIPGENAMRPGVVGGASFHRAMNVQARLLALSTESMIEFRAAMEPIVDPNDERPLSFAGLGWPTEHRVYARPAGCEFSLTASAVYGEVIQVDATWVASEPVVYADAQATAQTIATGSPVSTVTFQAGNAGYLKDGARRAWEFRMTAHGTTTNPRIQVNHADGTWERITLEGLTMTGGQVLIVRDGRFYVGTRLVHGFVRSTVNSGATGRTVRLWRLLRSTGVDSQNVVTMSVASGAFSGFCKVRSTW